MRGWDTELVIIGIIFALNVCFSCFINIDMKLAVMNEFIVANRQ